MAYEHNDIATKNRLMSGLGEELMGYEHNDIVTVDVMEKAIAEGGGGGGGESVTWILDNATATVAFDEGYEAYAAIYNLPETITADNLISTFSGKNCVTILDGVKIEAPAVIVEDSQIVKCYYWNALYDSINDLQLSQYELRVIVTSYAASDEGKTATLSFGIVDE